MGVDMGAYDDLIAHRMSVDGIRAAVGADSLAYLSLDGMMRALSDAGARSATGTDCRFCSACFSGDYPLDVGGAAGKNGFELI
jgi:amidophosphoribosyltransferase